MTRIDVSFNGHLPNCVCRRCGEARDMITPFRRAAKKDIKKMKKT